MHRIVGAQGQAGIIFQGSARRVLRQVPSSSTRTHWGRIICYATWPRCICLHPWEGHLSWMRWPRKTTSSSSSVNKYRNNFHIFLRRAMTWNSEIEQPYYFHPDQHQTLQWTLLLGYHSPLPCTCFPSPLYSAQWYGFRLLVVCDIARQIVLFLK